MGLEGTQAPKDLVPFFLRIWAKRDPKVCWKRTKDLFEVVGIEDWLDYDSWKRREPITVQNLTAIRASPFYLSPSALKAFPLGVGQSAVAKSERVEIMTEFTKSGFPPLAHGRGMSRTRQEVIPMQGVTQISFMR